MIKVECNNNLSIWRIACYLTVTVIVFLNHGLCEETPDGKINADCSHNFTENGKLPLKFNPECHVYSVKLDFDLNVSVVNLTLSMGLEGNINLTKSEDHSDGNFSMKFDIYESTLYYDGSKEDVLQEEWEVDRSNVPAQRNYFSRSPTLFILISSSGNWMQYDATFYFSEIPHSMRTLNLSSASGEIEDHYLPNSISTYRLINEHNKKWKGIEITVEKLNISKDMGEYVLIGAGSDIFQNKDYLPMYVTELLENYTFYVGKPDAFVAFISGPVPKLDNTIKIFWNRESASTFPTAKEDPSGALNSSLICFFNYSAAIQEFEKNAEEQFKIFRKNFAETVKELYREDKNIENIDSLDETSIKLFGSPSEERKIDALSILIKVMYEGKSIFTWNQLQKVIETFEQTDSKSSLEYKVGKCPEEKHELPYKDKWSFLIYIMVPAFGFLALMVWAWKKNIFSQKCTAEKDEQLCPAPPELVVPNMYEPTIIPNSSLHDDPRGKRTLVKSISQPEQERRDEEFSAEITTNSISRDTLARFLTSRSKQRPSIQTLIGKDEKTGGLDHNNKVSGEESQPLYDSISSNKEFDETKM